MHLLLFAAGLAAGLPTEAEVFAGVLARFDADGNGTVSQAEYARFDTDANFVAMDQDGSLDIDQAELTAWVKVTQPRPTSPRPLAGPGEVGPPEVLVQVVDGERIVDDAADRTLTLTIGTAEPVPLNDAGEGVDIASGDHVYSGLAPVPPPGPGPVEARAGTRTWRGQARFDEATARAAVPIALAADGTLAAHVGPVRIGGRGSATGGAPAAGGPPAAGAPAAGAPAAGAPAVRGSTSASAAAGATPPGATPGGAPPPAPSTGSPPAPSWRDGWPLYAGILGVGAVAAAWIELRGRRRRRRRR